MIIPIYGTLYSGGVIDGYMGRHENPAPVKTTEHSLRIIDILQELDGARIDEVTDHLDIAPSTAHRHLQTLKRYGYVMKEGDFYYLGLEFLNKGGYVRTQNPAYDLAKKAVDALAEKTQERVQFEVEENGLRYFLFTATGEQAVEADAIIGKKGPLHCSSAGKAILAELPDWRVQEIIQQHGLPKITEKTITDGEELSKELEEIRERGVAFNRGESTPELCAVASVVTSPRGSVLGAISVSGPAHRMKGELFEEKIPDLIRGATQELELNIKYSKEKWSKSGKEL